MQRWHTSFRAPYQVNWITHSVTPPFPSDWPTHKYEHISPLSRKTVPARPLARRKRTCATLPVHLCTSYHQRNQALTLARTTGHFLSCRRNARAILRHRLSALRSRSFSLLTDCIALLHSTCGPSRPRQQCRTRVWRSTPKNRGRLKENRQSFYPPSATFKPPLPFCDLFQNVISYLGRPYKDTPRVNPNPLTLTQF